MKKEAQLFLIIVKIKIKYLDYFKSKKEDKSKMGIDELTNRRDNVNSNNIVETFRNNDDEENIDAPQQEEDSGFRFTGENNFKKAMNFKYNNEFDAYYSEERKKNESLRSIKNTNRYESPNEYIDNEDSFEDKIKKIQKGEKLPESKSSKKPLNDGGNVSKRPQSNKIKIKNNNSSTNINKTRDNSKSSHSKINLSTGNKIKNNFSPSHASNPTTTISSNSKQNIKYKNNDIITAGTNQSKINNRNNTVTSMSSKNTIPVLEKEPSKGKLTVQNQNKEKKPLLIKNADQKVKKNESILKREIQRLNTENQRLKELLEKERSQNEKFKEFAEELIKFYE
jgi:hypothetical protein